MAQSASQAWSPSHPATGLGIIRVGALSTALARTLMRAWPDLRLHLSPRGETASKQLAMLNGVSRQGSNQSVADACTVLVIGVRLGSCRRWPWWLDQLGQISDWMVRATGMAPDQAQALLCANMADVATMLQLDPGRDARELARSIGTPGTYTALGLAQLQQQQAHRAWEDAMVCLLARLQTSGPRTDPPISKTP